MDYSHANLCCVLKVDTRCGACKGHTIEVLSSIEGVYDVTIDAKRKTVQIVGEVNPNYCMKALSRCGVHAELVWANLTHPKILHNNNKSPYSYGGEPAASGSSYTRSLPPPAAYNINSSGAAEYSCSDYSSSSSRPPHIIIDDQYYYDQPPPPPAARGIHDYNNMYPYVDHMNNEYSTPNFCSIM